MSEGEPDPVPPAGGPPASTPEEQRALRKRWLTLAEILGVAALVISALTLWNNVELRKGQETDRIEEKRRADAAKAKAAAARALVTFDGIPADGGDRLTLRDVGGHRVSEVTVAFPGSLGIEPRQTSIDPAIDADWVAEPLLDLTDGGPDRIEGRLPLFVTATYWQDGERRIDSAIYDLVFRTEGRMLRGRVLKLRGLVLRDRSAGDTPAAVLEKLWAAEKQRLAREVGR